MSRNRKLRLEELEGLVPNDRRESAIQGYAEFLKGYDWAWYGSLVLGSGSPTRGRANAVFNKWIEELRRAEGSSKFRFARVIEPGRSGANFHAHVLIGGLCNRRRKWEKRWDGNAQIDRYDADQEGVYYLLKTMSDTGDIDIEFELP